MIIKNQTEVKIVIDHEEIKPGESYECLEHIFDTTTVFSDIGSVEITTEYSKRYFDTYGNLMAIETDQLDQQELPVIIIKQK